MAVTGQMLPLGLPLHGSCRLQHRGAFGITKGKGVCSLSPLLSLMPSLAGAPLQVSIFHFIF